MHEDHAPLGQALGERRRGRSPGSEFSIKEFFVRIVSVANAPTM